MFSVQVFRCSGVPPEADQKPNPIRYVDGLSGTVPMGFAGTERLDMTEGDVIQA